MEIASLMSSCHHVFIEPFYQGAYNIETALKGRHVEYIFQQSVGTYEEILRENDLSLFDRVSAIVVGVILLIPIINAVVFAILQAIDSPFVFHQAAAPSIEDETDLRGRDDGGSLAPEEPIDIEPRAAPEEYQRRRMEAIRRIGQYPNDGHQGFQCTQPLLNYNLDTVIHKFNENHNPQRLAELCNYAAVPQNKRGTLMGILGGYEEANLLPRQTLVKKCFSKIYDFFQTNRAVFPAGSDGERAYKGEFRRVVDRIIDAHKDCVDQVLSQIEGIMIDVIADFESMRGQGVRTLKDRIIDRAVYTLFKYRNNRIKEILVTEYPDERHIADMERAVTQRLSELVGIQGAIFNAGAQFNVNGMNQKVENTVQIFLDGQPSIATFQEEMYEGTFSDAKAQRRREFKYDPVKFLLDNVLRTYHGSAKTLRNDAFIWMKTHFNFEADDQQTRDFVAALSEDAGFDVAVGGNLTHQSTLFLAEQLQLIESR